jgi:Domain of unknown function (DUF4116)
MSFSTLTGMPAGTLVQAAPGFSALTLAVPSYGFGAAAGMGGNLFANAPSLSVTTFGLVNPAAEDAYQVSHDHQQYEAIASIESAYSGIFAKELYTEAFQSEVHALLCEASGLPQGDIENHAGADGTSWCAGENGLFIKAHLDEIRSLATAYPDKNSRREFFNVGFAGVFFLIRKFGFAPFQRIVETDPGRAQVILRQIADLSELVYRIGMEPFARLVANYRDASAILEQIHGKDTSYPDDAGVWHVRFDFSMAENIRSMGDLLYFAGAIHACLVTAMCRDWRRQGLYLGPIAQRYGITALRSVVEAGERRTGSDEGGKALTTAHESFGSRFGYDFLAQLSSLTHGDIAGFIRHKDAIAALFSTPQEFMAFAQALIRLNRLGQREDAQPWDPLWDKESIGVLLDGFFTSDANQALLEELGISAFHDAFAAVGRAPDAGAFDTIAATAHLVKTSRDLAAVVQEWARAPRLFAAALPPLKHLIHSLRDLAVLRQALLQLQHLFGAMEVSETLPTISETLTELQDLTTAFFLLDEFYHPSFVDVIRSRGLGILVEALAPLSSPADERAVNDAAWSRQRILQGLPSVSHLVRSSEDLFEVVNVLIELEETLPPQFIEHTLPSIAGRIATIPDLYAFGDVGIRLQQDSFRLPIGSEVVLEHIFERGIPGLAEHIETPEDLLHYAHALMKIELRRVRRFYKAGRVLQDDALIHDRALALSKVRQDGRYLQNVDPIFRKDQEVVLAAVKTWPKAVEIADDTLTRDVRFQEAAYDINFNVLEYLKHPPAHLRHAYQALVDGLRHRDIAFSRRLHSSAIAREIMRNRDAIDRADGRPLAVVVYPKKDWNGAFEYNQIASLIERGYRVVYFEISLASQLREVMTAAASAQKISLLIVGGHGYLTHVAFGGEDRERVTEEEQRKYYLHVSDPSVLDGLQGFMEEDSVIVIESCSAGAGKETTTNVSNMVRTAFPQSRIFAPTVPAGVGEYGYDAGNRVIGIAYRDADDDAVYALAPIERAHGLTSERESS